MSLFRRTLLVAALLAGLLYAVSPGMQQAVKELVLAGKDWVESTILQKHVPVRPISAVATPAGFELPEHPADHIQDRVRETFWAAPDAAARPTIVVTFDRPTRLSRAIVANGGAGANFDALGRPRELHVEYLHDGEVVAVSDVSLQDTPEDQRVDFSSDGEGATQVKITVTDFYRAAQNPGVALSEIWFFERPS